MFCSWKRFIKISDASGLFVSASISIIHSPISIRIIHSPMSIRINHYPIRWLCIYLVSWFDLNSSARTIVTTITKMELHSTRILGNSPSSIKNSLTQNTPLICCQHNNILSLCCSIHHNTFWKPFKTSMELPSSLSYHLLFNRYINLR